MAKEINDNDLIGAQTLANITQRAQERGLDVRRDDVRFVLEVVSEADPWFEQGASANLFAGRFRNFVVARCRGQGLNLSADELDLIDAWFAGGTLPQPQIRRRGHRRLLPRRPMRPKPATRRQRRPSHRPPRHRPASPAGGPPATTARRLPRTARLPRPSRAARPTISRASFARACAADFSWSAALTAPAPARR